MVTPDHFLCKYHNPLYGSNTDIKEMNLQKLLLFRHQQLDVWYRSLWFSTIQLVLHPPLQYQSSILFFLFDYCSSYYFIFPGIPKAIPSIATITPFHYNRTIFQFSTFSYRISYFPSKTFLPISAFSGFKLQKEHSEREYCEDWNCFNLYLTF